MYPFPLAILPAHLFFPFFFSLFLIWNFLFSSFPSVLLFSLVLAGDCFSDDFGAFEGDFFLSCVTSMLLRWPQVSVHCVFVVTGDVAGIVAFGSF